MQSRKKKIREIIIEVVEERQLRFFGHLKRVGRGEFQK